MLHCPNCELAHFPTEVCGRDSERGLAYNGRLERARAALEAAPKAKGKGGRPRKHFDRNAYHKAYMREYMRAWRARRKGGGG